MRINSINANNSYNSFKGPASAAISAKAQKLKEPVANALMNFYEGVAKKEGFQKFVHKISSSDRVFTNMMVAESIFLSGFYMINTMTNKKIKKEQKPQMLINDALTLGVSTAGAFFAEERISNAVSRGVEKYFVKHADYFNGVAQKVLSSAASTPKSEFLSKVGEVAAKTGTELSKGLDDVASLMGKQLENIVSKGKTVKAFQIQPDKFNELQTSVKNAISSNSGNAAKAKEAVNGLVDGIYNNSAARTQAEKYIPGFNRLKTLVIFGIIYRYLGPVLITPLANKLSSRLLAKKQEKAEKTVDKK